MCINNYSIKSRTTPTMTSRPMSRLHLLPLLPLMGLLVGRSGALPCPTKCRCVWVLDSLEVTCAHNALVEYPKFGDMPIEHVDLSNNLFTVFPIELADYESLIYLDLSNNRIEFLDADALLGFHSLRTLLLANNSFSGWASLNPHEAFRRAISLKRLSLSGNQLHSFGANEGADLPTSPSLRHLELEGCGIKVAAGQLLMQSLPHLERLTLSNNPLNAISALPSRSLRSLELSNCNLQRLPATLLQGLPNLEALNISWNTALRVDANSRLDSVSLNELDVSFCSIDDIDLSYLPALTVLRLRGNMLRTVSGSTFANNTLLETLDLSRNSLRLIEADTFSQLRHLGSLDLSYNEIARLERNLFRANDALLTLNLSRNVIERFTKITSNSLRDINLSWCEIIVIEGSALAGLSSLQRLDLSHNLINAIPNGLRSNTLQRLDLSNCRLSNVRNSTFQHFPELASLRLNGNRFTIPFRTDYFKSNQYLDELWLGDNPWTCNCPDVAFVDFYDYLTAAPAKLKDKSSMRCASPAHYYGQTWEMACDKVWVLSGGTSSARKAWTIIMMCLVIIGASIFLFTCFQKYLDYRRKRLAHEEYCRNQEEMRNIRRRNQLILEQEGAPNAPSPFETNLPSYEDAINMPKPVRPVKSMVDLPTESTRRQRRKFRRPRAAQEEDVAGEGQDQDQEEEEEEDLDLQLDHRQRFHSEEMLSNRDRERVAQIVPYRRTGPIEHHTSSGRRFSIEESRFPAASLKAQNLQSAELIANFQSYENSPYTKRKPKIAEIPPFRRASVKTDSVEFLTDPEYEAQSKPSSPFARRKPKTSKPSASPSTTTPPSPPPPAPSSAATEGAQSRPKGLAPAIEDYFGGAKKESAHQGSTDSGDFHVVIESDIASLRDNGSGYASHSSEGSTAAEKDLMQSKRKRRRNSSCRRASGNFTAASAAAAKAADDSSSSEREPMIVGQKPQRQTPF